MSRLLLDTTAYSAMRRGDQRLLEPIQEATEIVLSSVVIGELLYGFAGGRLEPGNRRLLREFTESERVRIVDIDGETAEHYASIRNYLRGKGTPIPTNDLWIAALVVEHDLTLYSRDAHFKHLPQIEVA